MLQFVRNLLGGSRIEGADAQELVDTGAQLVDVRSTREFAGGHIRGAKNLPVGDLEGRIRELRKDQPVVVYCASGVRSASAAQVLSAHGFTEVHDLGGMHRWPEGR